MDAGAKHDPVRIRVPVDAQDRIEVAWTQTFQREPASLIGSG